MPIENEKAYQSEILAELHGDGWIYTSEAERGGYDKKHALFVPDVFGWLEETQPEALAKVVKPGMSDSERERAKAAILDRLVSVLNKPLDQGGGTLNVLRGGFDKTPAKFAMAEWEPATTHNETTLHRYDAVRVRVMDEVVYSTRNGEANRIDLVFFINGLPVATVELKTDNTQSLDAAVKQYREDRNPAGEPLLGFANRCLVHFAVSSTEAAMTTKLAGKDTFFLPFNMGDQGASGNPVNPEGASVSYLWERVWRRDNWLNIIGRLIHLETRREINPITGEVTKKSTLLFPRFHQWELVTNLLAEVRVEGAGHNYLVQHSAGSGKTNSISWAAHGLSKLHNSAGEKIFDSVIVVTDRTVLDDQLQKAISQIERVEGTVAKINATEVRNAGNDDIRSKSALLAHELLAGRPIVIVTMQTFPFALDAIRKHRGLAEKRFAIIADEAHSSQTGETSKRLRKVLTEDEQSELADGGEIDTETILAAEMTDRADSSNLSYFAFTATPKPKTLELFGRKDDEGRPRPFHEYTMRQAIEEGYILDVLRNYTTYERAFQIHQRAVAAGESDRLVDESKASKELMRWVSLHPTNIAQKVQIIVEHYRANVRYLLDGHAKAMVITESRQHAALYKEAIDAYIAKQRYRDIATLVAFSGGLNEKQMNGHRIGALSYDYTESNLNTGLRGRDIPTALASDDFQILLVANKFQTGFDQPLLSAMYVDKLLTNPVAVVQTLSRLNRTLPSAGKDKTFVLDFKNESEDILKAFRTYYETAELVGETDVDLIHDVRDSCDAMGIYTEGEIEAFVQAFLTGAKNSALEPPLESASRRFRDRYLSVIAPDGSVLDADELGQLEKFRKDIGSFVRLYDFLSQMVDYGDTGLEKRAMFFRLLRKRLYKPDGTDYIDLTNVELRAMKHSRIAEETLNLNVGESTQLKPASAVGSGQIRDPKKVLLDEILNRLNQLFEDEVFSPGMAQTWFESIVTVLEENPTIQDQAAANRVAHFIESPDLLSAAADAAISAGDAHQKMTERFLTDTTLQAEITRAAGRIVHHDLTS